MKKLLLAGLLAALCVGQASAMGGFFSRVTSSVVSKLSNGYKAVSSVRSIRSFATKKNDTMRLYSGKLPEHRPTCSDWRSQVRPLLKQKRKSDQAEHNRYVQAKKENFKLENPFLMKQNKELRDEAIHHMKKFQLGTTKLNQEASKMLEGHFSKIPYKTKDGKESSLYFDVTSQTPKAALNSNMSHTGKFRSYYNAETIEEQNFIFKQIIDFFTKNAL